MNHVKGEEEEREEATPRPPKYSTAHPVWRTKTEEAVVS